MAGGNGSGGFAVVQYAADGSGPQWTVAAAGAGQAGALAVQPGGRVVVAVDSVLGATNSWTLSGLADDGTPDTTFDSLGQLTGLTGAAAALAVEPDGGIVVAGQAGSTDAYFARYTSGGLGVAVSEPDVSPQSLALTFNGSAIGTSPIGYSGGDTDDGGSAAGVEVQGSFTDPGTVQEPHVVTIAWGDDSTPATFDLDAGQTSFDYPLPQYAAPGTYTVTVTVANLDGSGSLTQSFTVNYTNSQPAGLVLSLDQSTITAGDQVNLSGSFTDPQQNVAHTVTIDWGDGTETSPDVTTLSLDPGETTFQADPQTNNVPATSPYTIHVTVSGLDGSVSATTALAVNPAPPLSIDDICIGSTIQKGAIATLSADVANLNGMGFTLTVDWGPNQSGDSI